MTTLDHIERVKKLARAAALPVRAAPGQVCACPTCGVVNYRLRAELMRRGLSKAAAHHVRIEGYDFRGAAHPYLASVRVDGEEVFRCERDLAEALDADVLDTVERRLRQQCSQ